MNPAELEKAITRAIQQMALWPSDESYRQPLRELVAKACSGREEADLKITRPVLRYHGGKFRLAPWILQFFPQHKIYVEPFGGAGSVLLQKPRVLSEVYNDLDSRVVNVFRVLRDPEKADELRRLTRLTPFAREEFDACYLPPADDIDAAHKSVVLSFFGHGSDSATRKCRTGFRAKCHDRALPCIEWMNWPDAVPTFTERLRGVVIENRDAFEIMERYNTRETLYYMDPPYCHSTRTAITGRSTGMQGYAHEMTDDDHRRLAGVLHDVKGMVVLSGYPSDLYDKALYPDWFRYERPHVADGGNARTEVVWLNQRCQAALDAAKSQLQLFA